MKCCKILLLAFCIFAFAMPSWALRDQAVGAKGILRCGDKPAAGVIVKLMDKDTGENYQLVDYF